MGIVRPVRMRLLPIIFMEKIIMMVVDCTEFLLNSPWNLCCDILKLI